MLVLGFWKDVVYALQLFRRDLLFAVTATLSLAIGIGANTTIFTVVDALLISNPAGVADSQRLVDIGRSQAGRGFDTSSYPSFLDLRARATAFTDVYAYRVDPQPMSLGGDAGAERVYGAPVSANYFSALGVEPRVGRFFTLKDGETEGASPLAVIGYRLWTRHFHSDLHVVGQTIVLNGSAFMIVGVAPPGFQGTTVLAPDLWVPLSMVREVMPRDATDVLRSRATAWLMLGARLKPGVTLQQAQADTALIGQALEREHPVENKGRGLVVLTSSIFPGRMKPIAGFMALLTTIGGLVLLIACVNLSGVLLARGAGRRREIAVRLALGAGRGRLVRQLLTETAMLFVSGAIAGLALARGMTTALVGTLPALPVPVNVSLALDGRVIEFTLVLSLAAAVVSGLVPALQTSRADVVSGLKHDQQDRARLRLRNAFVVGQVALSLLLVVGAGLFTRALHGAASIDPGFEARGVELTAFDFSIAGYDEARGRAFEHQLLERVRALPGVEDASVAAVMPLGGEGMGLGNLSVPGASSPRGEPFVEADWNVVDPHYFSTMKMRLVAGRDFTDADRRDAPWVVIVNQTAARRFWPGADPLNQELAQSSDSQLRPAQHHLRVVGVVRDFKGRSLDDEPRAFVFVPVQQQYVPSLTIVARAPEERQLAGDIRSLVASMDRNLPILRAQRFEEFASIGLVPQRVAASVSGSLGIVGLLLAAMGIYGVTAYGVARRTREIGIRMALGARPGHVVRMVLRQGLTMTLAGMAIGLPLAGGASLLLGSLLFGVAPIDPVTFTAAALLFVAVGLAACYGPARRATEIDAIKALRYE